MIFFHSSKTSVVDNLKYDFLNDYTNDLVLKEGKTGRKPNNKNNQKPGIALKTQKSNILTSRNKEHSDTVGESEDDTDTDANDFEDSDGTYSSDNERNDEESSLSDVLQNEQDSDGTYSSDDDQTNEYSDSSERSDEEMECQNDSQKNRDTIPILDDEEKDYPDLDDGQSSDSGSSDNEDNEDASSSIIKDIEHLRISNNKGSYNEENVADKLSDLGKKRVNGCRIISNRNYQKDFFYYSDDSGETDGDDSEYEPREESKRNKSSKKRPVPTKKNNEPIENTGKVNKKVKPSQAKLRNQNSDDKMKSNTSSRKRSSKQNKKDGYPECSCIIC